MSDVVVTVPKRLWAEWIAEGDLPGDEWSEAYYGFNLGGRPPQISPGERVYVVAHGRLRGYAPLFTVELGATRFGGRPTGFSLVRRGGAVAVTIPDPIRGFQGWRYRWWSREAEIPFPTWKTEGVPQ